MGVSLGPVWDFIGGGVAKAGGTGAFEDLGPLGGTLKDFLLKRLQTPGAEQEQFKLGSSALRDALSGVAGAQRQRLGDTALASGFLDSGAVSRGLGDIDRAELGAFSSGIRDLLMAAEDRRTEGVLPFLLGGSQEKLGVEGINVGADVAKRGQNMELITSLIQAYATMAGGGCWVAREVYGIHNPKWLQFRHWMFNIAPVELRTWYVANGPQIAAWLRVHPEWKPRVRQQMDRIIALHTN